MNIFYLDRDPRRAARAHCDKHVVKMTLESAQILSTALAIHGVPTTYKPTHRSHPCVLWAAECSLHYEWVWELFGSLLIEYARRYRRQHASGRLCGELAPSGAIPPGVWREPPLAMPDRYKQPDAVAAYRAYYLGEKMHFARWDHCSAPAWIENKLLLSA